MTIGKGLKIMLDFKWQSTPGREKHKKEKKSNLWQMSGKGQRSKRKTFRVPKCKGKL